VVRPRDVVPQMPAGAVHQPPHTIGRPCCSHVRAPARQPLAMGIRHKPGTAMPSRGADRCQAREGFPDHGSGHDGAARVWSPTAAQGLHEPQPAFICGHAQDGPRLVSRTRFQYCLAEGGDGFFHVSCAS
jgi:hypothetical protein